MRNWQIVVIGLSGLLTGCANWNSIHHTFGAGNDPPQSISIDAKQRVVIAMAKRSAEYDNGKLTSEVIARRACAEPSPDAISALASSMAGSGELTSEKVQAALKLQAALSQTETSSFVGIRTQTIQLLRDGMYRLCEAYMSDALDGRSYNRLQRRYQNLMMGLLSIEQLTGAIVAPQIAIVGGAAASQQGASELVRNQMTKGYTDAKAGKADALKAKDSAKVKKQAADNAVKDIAANNPVDKTKLADAVDQQTLAEKTLISSEKEYDLAVAKEAVFKEGFEKALSVGVATVAGGSAQVLQNSPAKEGNDFAKMAETVRGIVELVINKALVADECFLTVSESMNSYTPTSIDEALRLSAAVGTEMARCSTLGSDLAIQKLRIDALASTAEQQKSEIENLRKQLAAQTDVAKVQALEKKLDTAVQALAATKTEISAAARESTQKVLELGKPDQPNR